MEELMQQVTARCTGFEFWHKLYADDLVICVNYQYLEKLLATLKTTSDDFQLRINPKKCAIFAIRGHDKLNKIKPNLQGVPVQQEYCYLGVTIDHSGSLAPQLDRIKTRSNYLRANIRYYTNDLSFENQYLLWSIYVRPYYMYTAPVIATQTNTTQKRFHSSWRNSFKQFMGLPKNLPS